MIIYDIWLQCVLGYGNKRLKKAIEYFGNSESIYKASDNAIINSQIFTEGDINKIRETTLNKAKAILNDCSKRKISIITISQKGYPKRLWEVASPPIVLYYRGNFPDFDNIPTICVIGQREISEYGAKCAFSLGIRLAKAGMLVVSGGARGGDKKAHLGSMAVGCPTVAILGCGLDYPYLPENEKMRKDILKTGGCLISEYPPTMPTSKGTFPIRNRILSGLSLGVIVVEAKEKSGCLNTTNHALEQGRDIFVVPGRPDDINCKGSNILLKEGAIPLLSAMDIFNEYLYLFPDKINIEAAFKPSNNADEQKNKKKTKSDLSKIAKMVYNNLNTQIFSLDDIYVEGLSSGEIISAFTELEILGYIKAVPGGRYIIN